MKKISNLVLFFVLLSLIMINTIAYACPAENDVNLDVYGVYKGAQASVDDPCLYIILAPDRVCYFATYYPGSNVFVDMCKISYEVYGDTILLLSPSFKLFVFRVQDNKLIYKTYDDEVNVVEVVYEKQDISIDDFMKGVLKNYIN